MSKHVRRITLDKTRSLQFAEFKSYYLFRSGWLVGIIIHETVNHGLCM